MSTLNEKLTELEQALTPARRRKVYRLATIVVLVVFARQLSQGDVLEALAILLGVAPTELAARNVAPTPGRISGGS